MTATIRRRDADTMRNNFLGIANHISRRNARDADVQEFTRVRDPRSLVGRRTAFAEAPPHGDVQEFTLAARAPRSLVHGGGDEMIEVARIDTHWSFDGVGQALRSRFADDSPEYRRLADELIVPRAMDIARSSFQDDCMLGLMIAIDVLIHRTYESLARDEREIPQSVVRSLVRVMTARIEHAVRRRLNATGPGRLPYGPTDADCRDIADTVDAVLPLFKRAAAHLRDGDLHEWRAQMSAEMADAPEAVRAPLLDFICKTPPRAASARQPRQMALRFASAARFPNVGLRKLHDFYTAGKRQREVETAEARRKLP